MAEERRVGGDEAGRNLRGRVKGDPDEERGSVVGDDGAGAEGKRPHDTRFRGLFRK